MDNLFHFDMQNSKRAWNAKNYELRKQLGGTLHIKITEANIYHYKEKAYKVYVQLHLGTQLYRTRLQEACEDNCYNPQFKQEDVKLTFKDMKDNMTVSVYKSINPEYSVMLGQGEFDIVRLTRDETDINKEWFFVAMHERVSGHVFMEIKFNWVEFPPVSSLTSSLHVVTPSTQAQSRNSWSQANLGAASTQSLPVKQQQQLSRNNNLISPIMQGKTQPSAQSFGGVKLISADHLKKLLQNSLQKQVETRQLQEIKDIMINKGPQQQQQPAKQGAFSTLTSLQSTGQGFFPNLENNNKAKMPANQPNQSQRNQDVSNPGLKSSKTSILNLTNGFAAAASVIALNKIEKQLHKYKLTIRIVKGELSRNSDYIAEMRPFIKVFYKRQEIYKTRVSQYPGMKPEWNETFEIKIDSIQDQLLIQICEKDWTHEYHLGEAVIPVGKMAQNSGSMHWVSLHHKFHHAADILFWSKLAIREDIVEENAAPLPSTRSDFASRQKSMRKNNRNLGSSLKKNGLQVVFEDKEEKFMHQHSITLSEEEEAADKIMQLSSSMGQKMKQSRNNQIQLQHLIKTEKDLQRKVTLINLF